MRSSQAVLLSVLSLTLAGAAAAQGATASAAASTSASTSASDIVLVDGKPIGAAEQWGAKPVGEYDLTIVTAGELMPAHLTIADSAGKVVSFMSARGEQKVMPLEVTVNGTDLKLVLNRAHAPITMHLLRRGDHVSGKWAVGDDVGTLEGAVAKTAAVTSAPSAIGPAEPWSAKPVGKYMITLAMPTHEMTADVTVREENGKLIANIWPVGDNDGRDFNAAVQGNQFVITGTTERGALNLTLERRGSQLSGTWQLGEQKGAVTGSAK